MRKSLQLGINTFPSPDLSTPGLSTVRSKLKCPVFVAHDMSGLTN
jgi:hypothetical protein